MRNGSLVLVSRRRRRHRKKSKLLGRVRNLFLVCLAAAILALVGLFGSFSYTYAQVAEDLPDLDDYRSTELAQTSVVYDANGDVVDELYGVQNRYVVNLDQVDPTLQDAVISIEDHRFYHHRGLDFAAIARAAKENVQSLSIQEGGSTITQQLVKNTYIAQEQRFIPSFDRKMVEASLAWQYEKEHSKDEILEQYLNTVYFGANAYGAEAASRTYFDKHAGDLTLAESAMLAGIINLPGAYDPFSDPESANARRDVVLGRMLAYGRITKEEHDEAVAQDLNLSRGRVQYENDNEYFLNAVRNELAKQYGDETVYEGGLKIYTTLDPELQEMANTAVDEIVNPEAGDPSAALVSVDPATGAVRAMVGGSDFDQVKFNLATQAHRQAGSSFKPFVYAEALAQGISPETMYVSKHLDIDMGRYEKDYQVDNYDFIERGPITLERALADSDNTVFVQLAIDLGLENVVDMVYEIGITSEVEAYPSTAIGGLGEGVTPLEMASAYSTFANSGTHMEPFLVERVTRDKDGEEFTVEQHNLEGKEALGRDEAAVATQAMRRVITDGTASYYHDLDAEIGRPAAGKTGTTNNFVDAWFIGYIPQLTTSVWVGYPEERVPMVNINGLPEINGENYPLDIWSLYMQNAVSRFPEQQFDVPSPSLDLEVKTDGLAYEKPPEPETTAEETTEATTGRDNFADGFGAPESTDELPDEATDESETTTPPASSGASASSSSSAQPGARQPRQPAANPQRPGGQVGPGPRQQPGQSPGRTGRRLR
ncbi:MAG: transglycosylase domain-containing protein [Rubrobacteraceae bacterium]|nr:penicillin-binding protein [Rubrobacter sp.]